MKTDHPHKPYIKAYLIYSVITGLLFFAVGMPIIGIVMLIHRCLGQDIDVLRPVIPWFRSVLGAFLGYFVFRMVIQKDVLPYFQKIEKVKGATEQSPPAYPGGRAHAPSGSAEA